MNWLFVTSDPWPMHHGTALRVFHLARELAGAGERITVLSDWQGEGAGAAYAGIGVDYAGIASGDEQRSGVYPYKGNITQALHTRAAAFDVVVLFAAEMLQYAQAARPCPCVIADVIDDPLLAAFRRLKRPSSLRWFLRNLRLLWELRQYEKRFLRDVDVFTFVTDVDAGSFSRRNPRVKSHAIANGVAVDAWIVAQAASENPYLVFVGNYAFVPNRTAAEFLALKVAPLVWAQRADVRFCFVGSNPPDWLAGHPDSRIATTGFVEDVRPFIAAAKGVVIPMVTGTGIKNKLLEAWAAQKPVVATPLACQGIPAVDGENLLLGRNAREVAEAIVRLWDDKALAERLAAKGRDVVAREFSWATMAEALRRIARTAPTTGNGGA